MVEVPVETDLATFKGILNPPEAKITVNIIRATGTVQTVVISQY